MNTDNDRELVAQVLPKIPHPFSEWYWEITCEDTDYCGGTGMFLNLILDSRGWYSYQEQLGKTSVIVEFHVLQATAVKMLEKAMAAEYNPINVVGGDIVGRY